MIGFGAVNIAGVNSCVATLAPFTSTSTLNVAGVSLRAFMYASRP